MKTNGIFILIIDRLEDLGTSIFITLIILFAAPSRITYMWKEPQYKQSLITFESMARPDSDTVMVVSKPREAFHSRALRHSLRRLNKWPLDECRKHLYARNRFIARRIIIFSSSTYGKIRDDTHRKGGHDATDQKGQVWARIFYSTCRVISDQFRTAKIRRKRNDWRSAWVSDGLHLPITNVNGNRHWRRVDECFPPFSKSNHLRRNEAILIIWEYIHDSGEPVDERLEKMRVKPVWHVHL